MAAVINDEDDLSEQDVVLSRPDLLDAFDRLWSVIDRALPEPDYGRVLGHLREVGRIIGRLP
jgi:hypothetical protein